MDQATNSKIEFLKYHPELQRKTRITQALEIVMLIVWLAILVPLFFKPESIFESPTFASYIGLILILILAILSELVVLNGIKYLSKSLRGYINILLGLAFLGVIMFFNPLTLGFGTQSQEGVTETIWLAIFFAYYIGSKIYVQRQISRIVKTFEEQGLLQRTTN